MNSDTYYEKIAENIDQTPLTAPKSKGEYSEAFIEYLKLLYSSEEAELVQHLRMGSKLKSAGEVAAAAGKDEKYVTATLDPLVKKGHLIGFGDSYALPLIPLLVNVHQFRDSVEPDDIKAAELYQRFFIKDGYYRYYESSEKGTQIMRVIPVKRTLDTDQKILDTEEAHRIIESGENLRLVPCPCRTRTDKLGIRECKDNNPVGFCIMMGMSAMYFDNAGLGRKVSAEEAKKYFDEMQELGLVGTTENFEDAGHTVICLCCDCCCSQLRGRTRWENPDAVAPSNFVAESSEECIMCGDCVEQCPFGAISLDEDAGRAMVDKEKCMGCGVCAVACEQEAMRLVRLEREKPYPGPRELYKKIAVENRGEQK